MTDIPNRDAGQALLKTLNRTRSRVPKMDKTKRVVAKDAKFVPKHAIPIEELVLHNPSAEVHSLPDRVHGPKGKALGGVKSMLASKEERHTIALQLFEEKRRKEDQRHKRSIQDQVAGFEKKLRANTEHIEKLFVNLEEDKIISMEEGMFREIGEEIML